MKQINIEKVNDLLRIKNTTQVELVKAIGISASSLNMSLRGIRHLSMNYVFDIAEFFDVPPITLTEDYTKHAKTKSNAKPKHKEV